MAQPLIGFVGLGNLGLPMAANLVQQGWSVLAHDTDPARRRLAADAGGQPADALTDLAGCDYLCLAVPDGGIASDVLLGQGLLAQLRPEAVVLLHSTVLPEDARGLAQNCRDRGVAFLDAPVSGGAARARSGELTVSVGATEQDLERGRPVLEAESSQVVHVGEPGAGAAVKLANQLMLFSALAGAYEAMRLVSSYGVSEETVLKAVSTGTGSSWVSENWGFYDGLSADYDEASVPQHRRPWSKDLHDVVAAAGQSGQPAPLAELLATILPPAVAEHASRARVSGADLDSAKVGARR